MPILNMNYGANKGGANIGEPTNISATATSDSATIKWTDNDLNTILPSAFFKSVLVRKTGSAPTSPSDGTTVVTETVKNTYSSNGYTDTGLTEGTTYYYQVFSYSDTGGITYGTPVSVTPHNQWGPGANTLVYYNINDNDTNTTIYDLSGNGVNQTWYGTSGYSTDATYGRVATFNGSNYTQGGSIINFGNACTVITLVKFSSTTSGQTLVNQGQGSGRWTWGINYGVTANQGTNMACCFSGTSMWEDRTVETTGFTLTAGQWIMIAGTRASDNTAKIYINGVLNNTASNLSSPDYSGGSNLGFGQRGNQGNIRFYGDMKLVIGEDRTWTDKEIADLAREYGF